MRNAVNQRSSRCRLFRTVLFGALVGLACTGCSGLRFVVDMVPGGQGMTETQVLGPKPGLLGGGKKIAMVEMTGVIADATPAGLLGGAGGNPVGNFVEGLRRAAKDKSVSGVVVRVNSPGGAVTASDVCYRELVRFRKTSKKPVVVLMADVAASGGYYIACGGDRVIAHPSTVTGSIGVIMQMMNVRDGLSRIGIHPDAITSGPNKALGSPFGKMNDEHRTILQGMVNEFYGQFVSVVRENRPGIDPADIDMVTDGRVVTGSRALELGLVDAVGDLHDAYAAACEMSGTPRARLVKYHRASNHVGSAYATTPVPTPTLSVNVDLPGEGGSAGFYYLWDPTVW